MASDKSSVEGFESLGSPKNKNSKTGDYSSVEPSRKQAAKERAARPDRSIPSEPGQLDNTDIGPARESVGEIPPTGTVSDASYAERKKLDKLAKQKRKNAKLINSDVWIARNGHTFTFIGIFLFSFLVFFRPYELIPGLGFLASTAFYVAAATLAIYVPTQLSTEGNLTVMSTEVKCVLAIIFFAIVTMPISRDPAMAWKTFNDVFIKAVLMFVIMVNVIRTRRRLMAIIWLAISISLYLSYSALDHFQRGDFTVEGYRSMADVEGLFGNPNELALHLTTVIPLVLALGLASKFKIAKVGYFLMAVVFFAGTIVTYSRGGFLALIVSTAMFTWKVGRNQRIRSTALFVVSGFLFLVLAPGGYGIRIISIFIPALDPVGSSSLRTENLITSLIVTLRNPWGVGIGNSGIFGARNLQTHNAYTQVSSELGLLGLAAYLIFLISPLRKLSAIERTLFDSKETNWFYYMAIGLQVSIVAYMVSSFFASVAYNWFVYYIIAYAVAFRRIYQIEYRVREGQKEIG